MAKKIKGKAEEKSETAGVMRWMLTYLDMVTLLFGVFVLLYAISNLDKGKAERVAESLRQGFRGGATIFGGPMTGGQTIINDLYPAGSSNRSLYEAVRKATRKELEGNIVTITANQRGIRISFVGDVFFESGSATLSNEMTDVLSKVVPLIKDFNHPIVITGHTDDVPVHLRANEQREFKDNWELAALRAINVLRFCEDHGIDPSKMSAQTYGKYQPIDLPLKRSGGSTPEYRALNRRVDIIIETGKNLNQRND